MRKVKKVLAVALMICVLSINNLVVFAEENTPVAETVINVGQQISSETVGMQETPAEEPVNEKDANEEPTAGNEAKEDSGSFATSLDQNSMEFVNLNDCEAVSPEILESKEFNKMDRNYSGSQGEITNVPSESSITTYEDNDNTDPNYAYIVENDDVMQGTIQAENEFRWYAFILNEKSKATILLQMVESLDADLYLFQLNGSELELIGGSAIAGGGIQEYCTQVLDSGIYFFAVSGYSGTGNFAFAYYQSTIDVAYEVNDSKQTATNVDATSKNVGVLDHPNDMDYYKVTVANNMLFSYSITTTNGYKLGYAGTDNIYAPDALNANTLILSRGTYYFAVYSSDGSYSASSSYTVNFKNIGNMASTYLAPIAGISIDAGIIYQTDSSSFSSVYYVNGNSIDINYQWKEDVSNSYGLQLYDVKLRGGDDILAYNGTEAEWCPSAVWYLSSTRPNYSVSSRPALALTFTGPNGFYYIHCKCTGAYAMNDLWEDMGTVKVIIDPETGKMIDIYSFNYFYDFAAGSNSMTVLSNYFKDLVFYKL